MYNDKIEVIRENGNKRVVKRTIRLKRFNRKENFNGITFVVPFFIYIFAKN